MESYDAIIIGSGPNGLVNATYLTKAGWNVLLLEKNEQPGGGAQTAELTLPGFQHDVYAGFFILYMLSQTNKDFAAELEKRGLKLIPTSTPTGVAMSDGRATVLSKDMEANIAEAERLAPGDGAAWKQLFKELEELAPLIFGLLDSNLTSDRATEMIQQLMLSKDKKTLSPFAGEFMMSARDFLESTFKSDLWRGALAPWIIHTGHGPDEENGGFWMRVFSMATQTAGQGLVAGGAVNYVKAMVKLIEDFGGTVKTGTMVNKILVEDGKAVGVRTNTGEEYRASKAVIATTTPDQLYLNFLADTDVVPAQIKQEAKKFRYSKHSVFVVHLALDEAPRWKDERMNEALYTHIVDGLDGVSKNFNETTRGLLPAEPSIAFGAPTNLDPSRAPEGKAVGVLHAIDVPYKLLGDAAGKIDVGDGTWSKDVKEQFADRLIEITNQHIPNLSSSILARNIICPTDLPKYNPNWKYGDWTSGSHSISQHFMLRPLPSQPTHQTVVPNLYMIGASTYPGLGLGAGSGYVLAQELIKGNS